MTRVLVVVNVKGGTGKTTTVAYVAHALADAGDRVAAVDADKQGSLLRWAGLGRWTLPVLGLPTTTLHRQLWGVIDRARVDTIVIDTPPLEEQAGVVASALRVATHVLVPMAPTMMELDRIAQVWTALDDAAGTRDTDPDVWMVLTRTVANAGSTDTIREILVEEGRPVLTATVPRLERYAQAFGSPIAPSDGPYGSVVAELRERWQ